MGLKLKYEYVKNYYKDKGYELLSETYINIFSNLRYKCPNNHIVELPFHEFKKRNTCRECSKYTSKTFKQVYDYFKDEGCELLETEYINAKTKMKYKCECGDESYIIWSKFKDGQRCKKCQVNKIKEKNTKYTLEYVTNYLKQENYKLLNYDIDNKIIEYKCDMNHKSSSNLYSFITNNRRCFYCKYEKHHMGSNSPMWNPIREEIPLNLKLRNTHSKEWIIKHMKDDPNYNNFINDPDSYVLDHIIPVTLFCKLHINYDLDETKIRKIINHRDNLQLLTIQENYEKGSKGSIYEAAQYLMLNGIKFI